MDFSRRKLEILKAIIGDYIETAMPVGSRTVSRKYMPDLSSATIRNEMSDLEHMGYLEQPHTSAGRVPSQIAYRLYVDQLMGEAVLEEVERQAVRDYFVRHIDEMEQVVRNATRVISAMTNQPAIALTPQLRRTTLKRIQLIPVSRGIALVVIVTDAARVKQCVTRIPPTMEDHELDHISKVLTERFCGHALSDVDVKMAKGLEKEFKEHSGFFESLTERLEDVVVQSDGSDVILEGATRIFDFPEYRDIENARRFLSLMEMRDILQRILVSATKKGKTAVRIGDENLDSSLKDLSVVTATYRVGSRLIGAVGVIGPIRMDYNRAIGVLRQISSSLSDVMTQYMNEK